MKRSLAAIGAITLSGVVTAIGCRDALPTAERLRFEATAYSIDGTTASGETTRNGVVAADPTVLPLGTRIRVVGAGRYSGEYVVRDTGPAIKGHEIDIYMPSDSEARAFGRRAVEVEVLQRATRPGDRPS
jgi:3D (Asp-Asp-Asp) domain-containing protein